MPLIVKICGLSTPETLDAALAEHAVAVAIGGRIKVALDLRHLPLEMNGTKMYAHGLARALAELPEIELTLLAVHPLQAEGLQGRLVHPDDWRDDVHVVHKPAQIFDPTHAELPFRSRAHVVMTYQDLIAHRMAEAFGDEAAFDAYRQVNRLVLPAAQAVLTYSMTTALEFEREFAPLVDPGVVRAIPLAADAGGFGERVAPEAVDEALARLGVARPYFLAMASDHPHKNLTALLEAHAALSASRGDAETPGLALAGHAPRLRDEAAARAGGPVPGAWFLGPVSHRDLRILYQNALALVFPSLYEGFGLPPLEAMAAGTPVAAMPFTSVLEICRDAVLFAEGLAPGDLARAMRRLADEPELRRDLREAGFRRVRELSWEQTARETAAVYRRAILQPSSRSLHARRSLSSAIALWATPPPPVAEPVPPPEPPVAEPVPPPEPPIPEPVAEPVPPPEPMGVLNACDALRTAVGRRVRRDLARIAPKQYARLARVRRLAIKFVRTARADGLGAASGKAARKVRNKARAILGGLVPARLRFGRSCPYFDPPPALEPYDAWLTVNGPSPRRAERLAEAVAGLALRPRFSILTPVYDTPPALLREAVASVLAQVYEDWELVLADDASADPATRALLDEAPWNDPRVRVVRRSVNGNISAATNTAAEHATGDWFVLLDHDDLLHPEALARLAVAIDAEPDADLVYSDDDKVDLAGARSAPQFKPDWSPELLLSFCYTGHVTAVRAGLYREVGGMREGFEGSQDHDFWLRASEKARGVVHVPHVLYHWRTAPGSTAVDGREKPQSFEAGRRAVEEAFARRGVPCRVERPSWAAAAGCGVFQPVMPDDGPTVAVIVLATDRARTARCLASLAQTSYRDHRIHVVELGEGRLPEDLSLHVVARFPDESDRIAACNRAAEAVDEDLLLFLDDEVEATDPRWLSQMAGWARLPGVGAVGPRLLDSSRRVVAAGIVPGADEGLPGLAFQGMPWWDGGATNLGRVARNAQSAPLGCLLTPRRAFLSVGGFDAGEFAAAHADADYGWRLLDAGLRSVVCAEVEMLRRVGAAPSAAEPRADAAYRRLRGCRRDPYASPHHDPRSTSGAIRPTVVPVSDSGPPIRLAAFTHDLAWGGASRFELELAVGLKAAGAALPTVFSPVDGPLREEYEKAGVPIRIEPSWGATDGGRAAYAKARARVSATLRDEGFEAVHANTVQGFLAIDAARDAGTPSVWSLHEGEPWTNRFDHLGREVARTALECFQAPYRIVFTALATLDLWKPLDARGSFDLVRYALNVERFRAELDARPRSESRAALGLGDAEVCVLLLGTVCKRKGQHDLARAFAAIAPDVAARTRCVVVGLRDSLDYGRELRRLAEGLPEDRRERFRIVGETGATATYWQAADVFCCSSRIESYPHVVLEAMERGLPIVTTPVAGIPEQVRRDVNALFHRPGDVQALAAALEGLVRDDRRRLAMGEASSQTLRALPDHDEMIRRYARLVREAAEAAPPPAPRQAAPAPYRGAHFGRSRARSRSAG